MADRNPLWVSHAGGVVTIDDARIGVSALWTPGSSNVNARKGLRPGGTTAVATPGFVAQQTVADKTVKVNAFQAAIPASRATGSFIATMDAVKTIDLLTTHPAHATLQRNDLIVAQVSDETFDSGNGFSVVQIVGTPNASPSDPAVNITNGAPTNSPDYITLARVRVTALASTITTAMIDDLRPPWLVAAGGLLPILNAIDRGTLTPYDGMAIWRIDRQWIEVYSIAAGGWQVQGIGVCSSTADAATAITTPYTGQRITITTVPYFWTGSAWQVTPGTTIGGQVRVNDTAGAVTTTETVVVTSPTFGLDASSLYEVTFHLTGDISGSGTDFDLRIRADTLGGAQLRQKVMPQSGNAYPVGDTVHLLYGTTATESRAFVGTLQRVVGTATFTPRPGCYVEVRKMGTSSILTAL